MPKPPRFKRHRISRPRQWLGLAGLVLILALLWTYHFLTGPERIRRFAEAYLEKASGGIVRIDTAHFDLFEGLRLGNVRLATPPRRLPGRMPRSFDENVIFSARDLYLRIQPFSLITGDLVVPEIRAIEPRLNLLRDRNDGSRNWQWLNPPERKLRERRRRGPTIRLDNTHVTLAYVPDTGKNETITLSLDVVARCTANAPLRYDVRWRTRDKPQQEGAFYYDRATGEFAASEGGLPTIPMASVRWGAPQKLQRWMDILDIVGDIRMQDFRYIPDGSVQAEVEIDNASLAVMLNNNDRDIPRHERYLNLEQVAGTLLLENDNLHIDFTGQWHGAACRVSGRLFGDLATIKGFDDVGLAITITAKDLPLPGALDDQSPAEARAVAAWPVLYDICRLFKPYGRTNAEFHLAKAPGHNERIHFNGGQLDLQGVDATYKNFDYPLTNCRGTVRFAPDDSVHFENFIGVRGPAHVTINGTLSNVTNTCGVDLSIDATAVPLDDTLYAAMPSRYRRTWDHFDPRGLANFRVNLIRPESKAKPNKPWQPHIIVDFLGITACYDRLPLPLRDIVGEIVITHDRFRFDGLLGTCHGAPWQLHGNVLTQHDQPPDVRLHVTAYDLPLDRKTAADLPGSIQDTIATVGASGTITLDGDIFTELQGDNDVTSFALDTRLRLDHLCLPSIPLPLHDVVLAGELRPESLRIDSLHAPLAGDGSVRLTGVVPFYRGHDPGSVQLEGENVLINNELLDALPASAQQMCRRFNPHGTVDIQLTAKSQPARDVQWQLEQLDVTPRDLSLSPQPNAAALHNLSGTITLLSDRLSLRNVCVTMEDGTATLDGSIYLDDPGWTADLRATTSGLRFSDNLRRLLPWRMQRLWTAMRPEGRFDLTIDRLTLAKRPNQPVAWTLDGALRCQQVSLRGAGTVTDMTGTIDIDASTTPSDGMTLHGQVLLDEMQFGHQRLTNIEADLHKEANQSAVRAEPLRATLYGGLLTGFVAFNLQSDRSTYDMSFVMRDVSLAGLMNAAISSNGGKTDESGTVDGRFFLQGPLGDRASRQGGGRLDIHEARIMRLPIFLAILGVLNLAIPDENAFNQGTVDFALQGDTLTLNPIDLRGNAISLVGAGTMQTPNQELDLRLLVGSPHRLPRLGLLTEMAEAAARELMEVRVVGPLSDPKVEARPLRTLANAASLIQELQPKASRP